MQYPGLPGGIESFLTWERADWGLGCDIRDAQAAALDGDAHVGRDACRISAPPARSCGPIPTPGVGLVCLANRGTYSGWMMRPGRWGDLSDRVLAEAA